MTIPTFTSVPAYDPDSDENKKIYLQLGRAKQKLLIVRPITYQAEGFITEHKPEGTDVVFADVVLLDPIRAAFDADEDKELPAIDAPQGFRGQSILLSSSSRRSRRHAVPAAVDRLASPRRSARSPLSRS